MTKFKLSIGIVAIAVLVVVGIVASTNVTPSTQTSASLAIGKPAPDFTVQSIDGTQFSLAAHRGKPVIVFGMFGGCADCIPVGQTLNQIQKDFAAQGVSVVALDVLNGESTSTLQAYGDYIKADFPLVTYNGSVIKAYNLMAPEITYVIDKNGNIADINSQALTYEQYKEQINKIL